MAEAIARAVAMDERDVPCGFVACVNPICWARWFAERATVNAKELRFLIDLGLLVPVTAIILLLVYATRRRAVGRWRVWFPCEGLPLGIAIYVALALLRGVFLLGME